jgi:cyanophycin synthetase
MEFRKVRALRGPNIWANFPVLEALVDLGPYKDACSDEMPGFNERLKSWLPSLIEHRCSVGTRGGFFERLRRGTYLAHILEHVTLELQSLAGTDVGYGRARETEEEGVYKVAIEYQNEDLARACLEVGRNLCLAAVHDTPFDISVTVADLRKQARELQPPLPTRALLQAAHARHIPVLPLGGALYQLGHGALQRRLLGAQTDRTSALADSLARDHELARGFLAAAGIPVSEGRAVASAADAWTAAEEVGLPVLVRRRYGQAFARLEPLNSAEAVHTAYQDLARDTTSILVEHLVPGQLWRLLVIGEKLAAASHLTPAGPVDVTAKVHSEVAARAVEAAQAIGLDVAGIDVVATALDVPLEQSGGQILGVTSNPDLHLHLQPADGTPAPVANAIVDNLFPAGQTGRIPIVAVTGVNGKTTTTRLIGHIVAQSGLCVGMTCTEGIYVGGRRTEAGDCSGPLSARAILLNPAVEAAVLETARGGILRAGLGFDHCDIAVVTNIAGGDHLGISGIDTAEDLARVKRTVVDVVAKHGAAVLKANDTLVANMATHCPGSVIFFALREQDPTLVAHRSAGGRVSFVRNGWIYLAQGPQEFALISLSQVPFTHNGRIGFQVENALAAAAAVWKLGFSLDVIRAGLHTFATDLDGAPARFNVMEIDGATFIFDYGHNPSSLACVVQALDNFPQRRRAAVYGAAGDRRDTDIVFQGELLGHSFDRVILFEDDNCIRGRKPGETFALFRQGLALGKRVVEIEEINSAFKAAQLALRSARPGDLVLVQVELVDETVEMVRQHIAALQGSGSTEEDRSSPLPLASVAAVR